MKGFAVIKMVNGAPVLGGLPCRGYALCGALNQAWGVYMVSGTQLQLQNINALPDTYGICLVSESGNSRWPELDDVIEPAVRTRINNWLTARGYPTIPAGWTYRQVIEAVYRRLNPIYEIDLNDITDR